MTHRIGRSHPAKAACASVLAFAALSLLATGCSDDGDAPPSADATTAPGATTGADGATTSGPADDTATTTTVAPATTVAEDALAPEALPYVDALAVTDDTTDRCAAVQLVDLVGPDRLAAAGLDPASPPSGSLDPVLHGLELSAEEAGEVYDRMQACGQDLVARMVDDLVSGRSDDPAVIECLQDGIDPAEVRAAYVASLQGAEADPDGFADLASCFES